MTAVSDTFNLSLESELNCYEITSTESKETVLYTDITVYSNLTITKVLSKVVCQFPDV